MPKKTALRATSDGAPSTTHPFNGDALRKIDAQIQTLQEHCISPAISDDGVAKDCEQLLQIAEKFQMFGKPDPRPGFHWRTYWRNTRNLEWVRIQDAIDKVRGLVENREDVANAIVALFKAALLFVEDKPGGQYDPQHREGIDRAARRFMLCRRISPSMAPTHSDDFTSVQWFGTDYSFTKGLQAESVRLLWEEWKKGTPRLSEKSIGEKAGSTNDRFRLEHVFKPTRKKKGKRETHPAWGTMIKSVGKGVFALSPP